MMAVAKLPGRTLDAGSAVRLVEAPVDTELEVVSIATDDPLRSDRLASLGVVAGCTVTLRRRWPSFVVEVGETTLALDKAIAREIRVRPR